MAFTPRPLAVPNMRTDYSAENSAFANLGQTLGNLPGDIRKEQLQQQKQQLLGQAGEDFRKGDLTAASGRLAALGDFSSAAALAGLGQKSADRDYDRQNVFGLGGPTAPASSPVTPNTPQNLAPLFTQAQAKYGLPDGYLPQVAQIESSNNPNAQNPNSSAGGLFQFIDSTAKQYGLSNKFDPVASTDAAARLASDNKQALSQVLGREPTAGELYLAHQQGAGGAAKLLSNPDARAVDVVGADAVRLNGGNADMTAGQFASKWTGKLDGGKPVQMAQAQTGVNDPRADAAPSTGAPAQFYVPGTDPQAATQSILSDPKVVEWQRRAALARTESGQKFAERGLQMAIEDAKTRIDTGGPLDREAKRLGIEKSRQELAGTQPTPEMRNYEAYRQDEVTAGRTPVGRLEYAQSLRPKTEVNIDQKAETAYATANGKAISDRFKGIVEEGDAANQEAGLLSRIRDLGGSIKNMGTGAAIQARLAEAGIKVGENVDEITAYKALIDKLTPTQRIAGAGATSDFDAKMFKSALPSLMNRPGGNELIMNTLDALNTYKRQRGDLVAESMATNEKPAEVIKKLRDLPDPFAAFKDAAKGGMKDLPAGQSAPAPTTQSQQERRVTTIDDARSMPSGTIFVDPNGVRRRVP